MEKRLQALAWGLILIWFGIYVWLQAPPEGFLSLGLGGILLLENGLRAYFRLRISKFWVVVGLLFLGTGILRASPINLTAILLIGIGIWILVKHVFRPTNLD